MARKAGVSLVSLTDHDTVAGVSAMQEEALALGLRFLPGAEISTGSRGTVHVLAYGPAVLSDGMQAFVQSMGADRQQRAAAILNRLNGLGMALDEAVCKELLANPAVGRPHIARAMAAAGMVSTVRQAFDHYLGNGKCAYVPRRETLTRDAVRQIRALGAVPVLAHPLLTGLEWPALCALIEDLQDCGLMGLEVWHASVSSAQARQLDGLARRLGLLVTGGSDYHGDPGSTVHVGHLPAGWHTAADDTDSLLQATQL